MTPRLKPEARTAGASIQIRAAEDTDVRAVAALWRDCGLVVSYNPPDHDGHRGWLYYVAVDPARRGAGMGRHMVAHAEAWLAGQMARWLVDMPAQ